MSQELHLQLEDRKSSGKAALNSGQVPGIMYGQGKTAASVQVPSTVLSKLYQQAGTNKLIEISLNGKTQNVLFHDVQMDPLSRQLIHFDLYTVKMDEKIKTEVPLHYVNDAPAVYTHNAVLLKNIEEIEVEALPAKLPEYIEVDLEKLEEIGDDIFVKDLTIPSDVAVLNDPEELIVKADPPRSEEELEELEAPVEEAAEVESEHGGPKEDAEGESGASEGQSKSANKEEKQE
jgi:large subunit ribosomal protein L25